MRTVEDTPTRLVSATEHLIAQGGEEATTLRAVARAARANAAAVHYHFGGRDELLVAVVERQLGPLPGRCAELLGRVTEEAGAADLLAAALRPELELLARLRQENAELARYLGRAAGAAGPVGAYLAAHSEQMVAMVLPRLRRCVPGVGAVELRLRLGLVRTVVSGLFVAATPPGQPGQPGPLGRDDVNGQLRRLLAFCVPGLTAPPALTGKKKKRSPRLR